MVVVCSAYTHDYGDIKTMAVKWYDDHTYKIMNEFFFFTVTSVKDFTHISLLIEWKHMLWDHIRIISLRWF